MFFLLVVSGNHNSKVIRDNLEVVESAPRAVIDHVLWLLLTIPPHTANELPWILKHLAPYM